MTTTFELRTKTGDMICTVNHGECLVAEHLLDEEIQMYSMPGYCVECAESRDDCRECNLSVNVSNGNALMILERLGIEADINSLYGEMDPSEMLGRALVGNVGRDDSGIAAMATSANGTQIDGGVRAGYFEDRFGAIAHLASEAADRGLVVSWG